MEMRDMHSNIAVVHAIAAQVINSAGGAKNSGDVDLQGFLAAEVLVNCGASGDTLDADNRIDVKIEHADDDGAGAAGAYSACQEKDILGLVPDGSGNVLALNALTLDDQTHRFGYVGGKKFVKITVTPVGTLTNGIAMAVNIVKGRSLNFPTT
jgi:hypothetical protein